MLMASITYPGCSSVPPLNGMTPFGTAVAARSKADTPASDASRIGHLRASKPPARQTTDPSWSSVHPRSSHSPAALQARQSGASCHAVPGFWSARHATKRAQVSTASRRKG